MQFFLKSSTLTILKLVVSLCSTLESNSLYHLADQIVDVPLLSTTPFKFYSAPRFPQVPSNDLLLIIIQFLRKTAAIIPSTHTFYFTPMLLFFTSLAVG